MPIKINGATSGSTTIAAPDTGSDETIVLSTALASKLDLAGGKILQIVRATDTTNRSTTSTTFVDADISVTITPQRSDSAILVIWTFYALVFGGSFNWGHAAITDNSNNVLSGAEQFSFGIDGGTSTRSTVTGIGRSTPATTSAVTYKGRYRRESASGGTVNLNNAILTGQMYAIEVSA